MDTQHSAPDSITDLELFDDGEPLWSDMNWLNCEAVAEVDAGSPNPATDLFDLETKEINVEAFAEAC
jgi:hypothetical protein